MADINPLLALLAAVLGYLLGSISFARIVVRLVKPDLDISKGAELQIPDTDVSTHMGAVAGTTVATVLGDRYGCATSIGDILKVVIPTLVLRLVYPGAPYYLMAAAAGLAGHIWPVYHRFKGGRGVSAAMGGFLVVDPIGTFVTSRLGSVLGLKVVKGPFGIFLAYTGWALLMIPWLSIPRLWFLRHDLAQVLYAIVANIMLLLALLPDVRMIIERKRSGAPDIDMDKLMAAMPMGRGLRKMGRMFGPKSDEGKAKEG